jgi:4-amino-4-deoxy-L-arabinose transferase-like glycosyltransferase
MKQIPIKDDALPPFNKKSIGLIVLLVIAGIITGLILSTIFVDEANQRIQHFNDSFGQDWPPNFTFHVENLTTSEIIFPTLGVIVVCISVFLLIGLIAVYIKISVKTKSKYITGLLLFLAPLLVQSIFSVNTLRSLFVSSAIPSAPIRESIGFGFGGLGGILVIVSLFEIVGLSILLYLSNE